MFDINDCPCCWSGEVVLNVGTSPWVQWEECRATGPEYDNEEQAVEAWNEPTDTKDKLRLDCELLRRELDDCNGVIR